MKYLPNTRIIRIKSHLKAGVFREVYGGSNASEKCGIAAADINAGGVYRAQCRQLDNNKSLLISDQPEPLY